MSSSANRLLGIEFAYVFALIGCLIYIYIFTIGDKVLSILSHLEYSVFFDVFPAMFLFLNGTTVALTLRDNRISRTKLLAYHGKRGSILFLIGLVFTVIWPMNIFIVCGLLYFLSQYISLWNNSLLRLLGVVLIGAGMFLLMADVPVSVVYKGPVLRGGNLLNLSGFLFFNGYFSILPWSVFFIGGLIYGRLNITSKGIMPPSSLFGLGLVAIAFLLNLYSDEVDAVLQMVQQGDSVLLRFRLNYLPFIFYALGVIVILVNAFIFFCGRGNQGRLVKQVQTISSMKFSVLLFQIFIGLITIAITNGPNFANRYVLLVYVIFATFLTLYLAILWKRRINELGPVEWVVKRISGSTKKSR